MQKIKKIERKILQDDDDDVFIAMYLKQREFNNKAKKMEKRENIKLN